MTSILFVGLGAHLRGGLTVWRHANTATEQLQQRRVAFERLERDLANAFVYDPRPEAYGTGPGQLPAPGFASGRFSWFTAVPSSAGQLRVRSGGGRAGVLAAQPDRAGSARRADAETATPAA
jgi:hypothetical protein